MKQGICTLSTVPVRENPSEKSQMVNQLLFGDAVKVEDRFKAWYFIQSIHDNYAGWVAKQQLFLMEAEHFEKYLSLDKSYVFSEVALIQSETASSMWLSMGSTIATLNTTDFSDISYRIVSGEVVSSEKKPVATLLQVAKKYLNVPYLWGGRSFFGLDCSGFTQIVFKMCGYDLPRDSSKQAQTGKSLYLIEEADAGDLLFFGEEEGHITHVGILIDKQHLIHASGKVRIDKIDHYGIFDEQLGLYTHQLRAIQKIY